MRVGRRKGMKRKGNPLWVSCEMEERCMVDLDKVVVDVACARCFCVMSCSNEKGMYEWKNWNRENVEMIRRPPSFFV